MNAEQTKIHWSHLLQMRFDRIESMKLAVFNAKLDEQSSARVDDDLQIIDRCCRRIIDICAEQK